MDNNFYVETSMQKLINLAVKLIEHHGTFSAITNSSQHFASNFIEKCQGEPGLTSDGKVCAVLGGLGAWYVPLVYWVSKKIHQNEERENVNLGE